MPKIICLTCGKEKEVIPYWVNRKKYCCRACMAKGFSVNKVEVKCVVCGKVDIKSLSLKDRKYCSRKCYYQSQIGVKRPTHSKWMKKRLAINNPLIGRHLSLEHRQNLSGANSPRWKGGTTSLYYQIRALLEFKQWRLSVYERDIFTCQDCGISGVRLECHHKKSFSKMLKEYNIDTVGKAINCRSLWNLNNGITLCYKCHKKTKSYGRNCI